MNKVLFFHGGRLITGCGRNEGGRASGRNSQHQNGYHETNFRKEYVAKHHKSTWSYE